MDSIEQQSAIQPPLMLIWTRMPRANHRNSLRNRCHIA
jgi:hypothetical protein